MTTERPQPHHTDNRAVADPAPRGHDHVAWSLITVTYNSAAALRHFRDEQPPDEVEWLVVDNASADDSAATARALGGHVTVLPENRGFSAANNVGLCAARGRYVAFVNPDVRVDYSDLGRLSHLLDEAPEPILVTPQLLNPDGTPQPSGRGVPTLPRKIAHRLSREHRNGYRIIADPQTTRYVSWAMGAAVIGRRSTFRDLGGWDDHFFVYYEDHDLGLRAWRSGVPTVLVGGVRWTHGWDRATARWSWAAWRLELGGMVKFFARYPSLLVTPHRLGAPWSRMYAEVGRAYQQHRARRE